MAKQYHQGQFLHFPTQTRSPEADFEYLENGILIIEDGIILGLHSADSVIPTLSDTQKESIITHQGLMLPGMIDTHVHYPQMEVIASYGRQLLDWLNDYTFPAEAQFHEYDYGLQQSHLFLQQIFANGTTTAAVYATVHPESVEAFFTASQNYNARMICGKVLMDRNCPDNLKDNPQSAYTESKSLIEKWHGRGRQLYAITPRFAPTSTEEQLTNAGKLAAEYPDVFIQTHLSENVDEIAWVKELFPDCPDYFSVYEKFGLARERALFGHGIHLTDREIQAIQTSGSSIISCPTSNLFIGSGLFPYFKLKEKNIPIAVASDVGGGTSLNLFKNMAELYKVMQLQNENLNVFECLYLCTQGAACALRLEDKIGNLNTGTEADFIELDLQSIPILAQRLSHSKTLAETLFATITLADERAIKRTYISGELVYEQGA
ncbi:guanine deaminase [Vibrio sp.]|uniref:Guanine deaminase n=1 Tax=Vibrio viridaestus TaxID=2487322 RepID=A0A3N9TEW1_9VIBR|nr:guanine deaminase [Vibrio viridaestus]MDC0610785.1 guanine deaminase [Vibrio sp.]RQW62570.1 guanine deaminase [Vibrio viridaestus]